MVGIRNLLTEIKMLYSRGSSWSGYIVNLGVVTANIKLFEGVIIDLISPLGIPIQAVYVVAVFGYIGGNILVGGLDKRWGIWKNENDYILKITPEWAGLREDINDNKRSLK